MGVKVAIPIQFTYLHMIMKMNNLLEYGKEPEVKCGLVYDIIYLKNTLSVRKFESNKNVNFMSFLSELRL